ncbi:MAG: histidine kinase [Lachnospiraceae bacterium]|nr:histidine kinase [Lachnospiraceae bacterium]
MHTSATVYNIINLSICGASFLMLGILAICLPRYRKRQKQIHMLMFSVILQLIAMTTGVLIFFTKYHHPDFMVYFNPVSLVQSIAYQCFFAYLAFDEEDNFIPGDFAKSFGAVILFVGCIVIGFSPIDNYQMGVELLALVQILFMIPVMITVHGRTEGMKKLIWAMVMPCIGILFQVYVPEVRMDYLMFSFALLMVFMNYQVQLEHNLVENEKELADSKVRLLLEQIQPHFIFNSLSAIEELCMEDPEKACRCVHDFSGYLRTNLDAMSENKLVTLEEELENVRQYISLEEADPCCGFAVKYDIKVKDVMVPVLSVEPLVENAIQHGLAASGEDGTVWIESEMGEGEVLVMVRDNGSGLKHVSDQQKKRRGIGVENVKKRLEAQCGGYLEYEILDTGTRAIIHIPFKE